MKLLLVTAAIIMVVNALSDEHHWQEFKRNNGKRYRSLVEEKKRFNIFQSNLRLIEAHNERFARGEVTHKKGITVFTDITDEEFRSFLTPLKPEIFEAKSSGARTAGYNFPWYAPSSMNWTAKGAVDIPMDRGKCDSSWAFVAAGAIEARFFIKNGIFQRFSAQNLVDCSRGYGNTGCYGGNYTNAFNYIKGHGILRELEYPYVGKENNCLKQDGLKIRGYKRVISMPWFMQWAVAFTGPICATIHAPDSLKLYQSGIIGTKYDCEKIRSQLDHAVLIVGYGIENGQQYWICRENFGKQWGEKGYFRISKGWSNVCGINTVPFYPYLN